MRFVTGAEGAGNEPSGPIGMISTHPGTAPACVRASGETNSGSSYSHYPAQSFNFERNFSALRLGMKRYAPALTVTKRGSAEVRSRTGSAGIVMWLDGSSFRLLSPQIGSRLS